jgi:hypothetical protein
MAGHPRAQSNHGKKDGEKRVRAGASRAGAAAGCLRAWHCRSMRRAP